VRGMGIWIALAALALLYGFLLFRHAKKTRKQLDDLRRAAREVRDMDEKVYRLYQEIEGMLDNFESYVSEVHDELEARRTEILEMSRQATTLYMQVMQPGVFGSAIGIPPGDRAAHSAPATSGEEPPGLYNQPEPRPEPSGAGARKRKEPPKPTSGKLSDREQKELDRLDTKGKKVRFLMGRGFTLDEVARELSIGKGEIQLIVDLDKK